MKPRLVIPASYRQDEKEHERYIAHIIAACARSGDVVDHSAVAWALRQPMYDWAWSDLSDARILQIMKEYLAEETTDG